ncbi:efflux RND transporter periplasmic adaptor subunit [Aquamicrobium sp. LC103]|uniref:efflux RND transporter periplasmic adaptor subunit n=1 Tax=Aquamicrobium sp. LC103 TaxID=1120658 RepID=UPI00063E9F84|nr:efflux RND transporter periplasmic adaptor subunit [Aquamicrobium sp. LC103]TKT69664.1 efflux RND transporter periplasmic adaptor subunit [Aquamicrobium sp. LC103]
MSNWSRATAISSLLSFLAIAGCSQEAEQPQPPRAVRVVEIDPQNAPLAAAQGSGRIEARSTASVGFLVAGRLTERPVNVGTSVAAGDLIARIDPTDFQNKVVAAQAQVSAAQATVDQASPQESRLKKLLEDGFATRQQYEAALQALQGAQAQLNGASANLKLADDQLKYTQLLAPTDGVVTATAADVGQVVAAGQTVVELAQHGERDAVFAIAPQHVAYAQIGMPVKVWLQDKPSETTAGTLREVAPNADPVTGTYQVKVSLPDAPADMRLGAIVVGHAEVEGGLMVRVPSTALLQTGSEPQVWVVSQPAGEVAKRAVTVLRYEADGVIISDGLEKGDLVVTAGVNSLTDGQKVTVQKAAAQ